MNGADNNSDKIKKPLILRIEDIIPPYNNALKRQSHRQNNDLALPHKSNDSNNFDIPTFDIASQILSQQRQHSAMKRISPARHNSAKTQLHKITQNTEYPYVAATRQDRTIIKDIVRRDIEMLCRI